MKYKRGSKCHYTKWLTKRKQEEIKELLQEYARVGNYFIQKYEDVIPEKTKFDLLMAEHIQAGIKETGTFMTARLVKQCFAEAYSLILTAKHFVGSGAGGSDKYHSPKMYGKRMLLSECSCEHGAPKKELKGFDYMLTLKCLRTDKKLGYRINIPLKKTKVFNKWDKEGNLCKSVSLHESYVRFSFEVEVKEKKTTGKLIGIDLGLNKLCTLSDGAVVGADIRKHLEELANKKQCSKAWYRKKEFIKEYINKEIKKINFKDTELIVCEKLKGIKNGMRGRLPKNIRSVFFFLSFTNILKRIQLSCEDNRVTFRTVPSYNTSIRCSVCGHEEKKNRKTQENFTCRKCGHSENADVNASKNILQRFVLGTYGSQYQRKYFKYYGRSSAHETTTLVKPS